MHRLICLVNFSFMNLTFFGIWLIYNPFYFQEMFTVERNTIDPDTQSCNDRLYSGNGNVGDNNNSSPYSQWFHE